MDLRWMRRTRILRGNQLPYLGLCSIGKNETILTPLPLEPLEYTDPTTWGRLLTLGQAPPVEAPQHAVQQAHGPHAFHADQQQPHAAGIPIWQQQADQHAVGNKPHANPHAPLD